jgi:DNA-binding NarL/FixJ family response regulator
MDSPQILQFVDKAVWAKTGKHLNNLQRGIISGILKRQRYADVAETYGYSSQHVKKASHELLQMLSEVFGEQVKKSNLESVIERQINQNITTLGNNNTFKDSNKISYVNNCPNSSTPTPDESQPETPDLQDESKNQTQIETIDKLRRFGLSDEQIAEALDISLEQVKQVDLEE